MPSTTPKGFPFPLGTDRVMDGDDAIHSLASAVDTMVGVLAAGIASITTPASGAGTAAVTFPVGRFTVAPIVTTLLAGGSTLGAGPITANTISAAGMTLSYNRNASGTFSAHWIAIQNP